MHGAGVRRPHVVGEHAQRLLKRLHLQDPKRRGPGVGGDACPSVIPNLSAPAVEAETADLRVRLEPIHPDADQAIQDPANGSKALPTCLLHLERKEGAEGPDIAEAIEVFGWLLSFYAGGAVHPNAW